MSVENIADNAESAEIVENNSEENNSEEIKDSEVNIEEVPVVEPVEDSEEMELNSDIVAKAMEQNKFLKKQLEELKSANTNVFEQNEILKAELENQQKLVKIAKENEEIKAQLSAIKKNSLIESLIASGGLTNDLRAWAEDMSYEKLQKFAEHAPKIKTILEEKNDSFIESDNIKEWHKNQSKARIL